MTSDKEIWKDIAGWEGIYQISNKGRIKSFKQDKKGKILSLANKKGGYFSFVLQKSGMMSKSTRIHRLVAEAFLPNPHNLPEVNHIDGNKQNNSVENLEWCTRSHNAKHSIAMHPHQIDKMILFNKYGKTDPILQISKSGEVLRWFPSGAEAGRQTGICARNIMQVANRTPFNDKGQIRKTAGGYIWRFESEVMQR